MPPSGGASRQAENEVEVVGAHRHPVRDAYHGLLSLGWLATFGVIAAGFLGLNAAFALAYLAMGGIAGAREGAFADAFFFSVQTMGTIGYGAMYPKSVAANVLVVAESVVGLVVTALATGLVFNKFSLSRSRVVFSREVTISPMNEVPTLSFRVGHDRSNSIVEAHVRVALLRTETTREGVSFYRMTDVALVRDRSPAMSRSWTVLHTINEQSPFHQATPASLAAEDVELVVTLVGTDDTSLQSVYARHRYTHDRIVFGVRHADMLRELPNGRVRVDVRRFHDLVAAEEPSWDVPGTARER